MSGVAATAGLGSALAAAADAAAAVATGATGDLAGSTVAQSGSLTRRALVGAAQVLGVSLVAAGVAAAVALVYRWYVRERVPGSLPALFGLSAIVPLLGTSKLLQDVIETPATGDPIDAPAALFNIAVVLVALAATRLGAEVGDRLGSDVAVATGERAVETEVGRVVQAVGRVITVELPEEVDDIVGYDPVPAETKEALAGRTFVFPRRLTVEELRDRLVTRLKADYAVGHVDIELADDGSVEYLAVGSRAAGIGPTLPPETAAVAVTADPALAASAGDLVQVWRTDPFERVLTAELRGTVDDVATLAIDAADTRKLDAEAGYKLVTLPVETRPDREFASVLRAADETMAAVTVAAGSDLAGQPVGALDVTVVAVRPESGPVEPLPGRDRALAAGDAVYVVAAPEAIRKVELGAAPPPDAAGADSTAPSADSGAHLSPDDRVDATTPVAGESADDPGPAAAESPAADSPTADSERDGSRPDAARSGGSPEGAGTADAPESEPSSDPLADPDGTASESGPGDDGRSTDSGVDDSSDESVPGIRTLEDAPSGADEPTDSVTDATEESPAATGGTESGEDQPDDDLSREELEDLPGTDVDDLIGTDVTAGESTADESDDGEPDDDAPDDTLPGGGDRADDSDEAGRADDGGGGGTAGDADAGDGAEDGDESTDDGSTSDAGEWSVAVDQRREDAGR